MKVWQFSEQAYDPAWAEPGDLRVTLPDRHCDPAVAGALLNRYLDEYMLADELGFGLMVNEHHASATCMSTACMTTLGILARQTRKAGLLALGIPISHRSDPVRVAEEIALVDAISGGRLEVGMVKAAGYEAYMSNQNPTALNGRFWEAHDLIVKAMTTHERPFRWEGDNFHYRHVSLWPRPLQQPHPPIWMTASGAGSAAIIARKGYVCATFLCGATARSVFDGYRASYREAFGRAAPPDRLGYLAVIAVGHSQKAAYERAALMKGYFDGAERVARQFRNPPGFAPVADNVRMMASATPPARTLLSDGRPLPRNPTIDDYVDARLMFVGTPDRVYEQIRAFHAETGGFGHLLMMGQAGPMDHASTVENLGLFAQHVLPRLHDLEALSEPAEATA